MGNTTPTATSFVPALGPLPQPGSTRVRMRTSKGLAEKGFHFLRLCFGPFPKAVSPATQLRGKHADNRLSGCSTVAQCSTNHPNPSTRVAGKFSLETVNNPGDRGTNVGPLDRRE